MGNEIQTTNQNTGIANFEKIEKAIREVVTAILATEFNVMTPKGITEAREVRAQVKALRINLGKAGKTAKTALNTEKKRIDTEVNRLTELALTGEEPLHKMIKDREDVLAEEKRKRDEAERERKTKIQNTIQAISALPAQCHGKASGEINGVIEYVEAYEITGFFEEFTEQAENAKATAIAEIKTILDSALQREQEDADRKAEAERLAEQKRIQDERQAKMDAEQDERDRVFEIRSRMQNMAGTAGLLNDATPKELRDSLTFIHENMPCEKFGEFREEAIGIWEKTISDIEALHAVAVEKESASIEEEKQEEPADVVGPAQDQQPGESPAAPASTVQDEEPEWAPPVYRLKKDLLRAILDLSSGMFHEFATSNEKALDMISAICETNLKVK